MEWKGRFDGEELLYHRVFQHVQLESDYAQIKTKDFVLQKLRKRHLDNKMAAKFENNNIVRKQQKQKTTSYGQTTVNENHSTNKNGR